MNTTPACAPPILDCRRLRLQAGPHLLIDSLDWVVSQGEMWCILGPNGVGKSTLLYTLAGVLAPAAGVLEMNGKPLGAWKQGELARMRGMMAQQQVDAFPATVLDVVLIGRTPYRLGNGLGRAWDSDEDVIAARAALTTVGMNAFEKADVRRLSGGERQRVALATLLVQAPELMLLDEPTSHQDVAHQGAVMRLVRSRSPQHTVVVATHDINLAARHATHVLLCSPPGMHAGPVEAVLNVETLAETFGCEFQTVSHAGRHMFMVL